MPEIKNRFEFEPDASARYEWLSTRKRAFQCGNQTLPGFYQTVDFKTDKGWVILALIIEAVAIVLTIAGGFSRGGILLIGSIIVVLLFLIFDYVGAKWVHKNVAKKCSLKSRIPISKDDGTKQGLRDELKKNDLLKFLGVVLIILSAVLKIGALFAFGRLESILYLIMALFYLIVIYIHISHTGFFLAEVTVSRTIQKQFKIWAKNKMNTNTSNADFQGLKYNVRTPNPKTPFATEHKLNFSHEQKVGEHLIRYIKEKNQNGVVIYNYEIETKGILEDKDIIALTHGHSDDQTAVIALACLKHQVERIHP